MKNVFGKKIPSNGRNFLAYIVVSISVPIAWFCSSCAFSRKYKLTIRDEVRPGPSDMVLIVSDGTWIPLDILFGLEKSRGMICLHVTNGTPVTFDFPGSTIQFLLFDAKTSNTAVGSVFRNVFDRKYFKEPFEIVVETQQRNKRHHELFLSCMTNELASCRKLPDSPENPTNLIHLLEWHLSHIDESYRTHEAQFGNADE
ncbi:MAG: hypothetical protein IJ678_03770 [Kiritimatiellae bacterium]|nr:hypothetical protein [Kiritimatiellia bacterium]